MTKSYLVTGANSGFGRSVTEALLARGDRVAALVRRPETLSEIAPDSSDRMLKINMDLTNETSIEDAVTRTFVEYGYIDGVFSNAGYGTFGAIEELAPEQIRRQIETNLIGTIRFLRALLPRLR